MGKCKVMDLVDSIVNPFPKAPPPRNLQEQMVANCPDPFLHGLLGTQISLSSAGKLAPKWGHCSVGQPIRRGHVFLPFSCSPHLSESRVHYRILHLFLQKKSLQGLHSNRPSENASELPKALPHPLTPAKAPFIWQSLIQDQLERTDPAPL